MRPKPGRATRFAIGIARTQTGDPQLDRVQEPQHRIAEQLGLMPFVGGVTLSRVALPGIRGRVRSIAGAVLTLWNPEDVINFSEGLVVEAAATDGTTGLKHAGSVKVAGVSAGAGTVTATSNWTAGIPALAANDFLFGVNEFGPPVRVAGSRPPRWSSGALATLRTLGLRSGGVLPLRTYGSQPAVLRTVHVERDGRGTTFIVESRYATIADLFVF